MVSELHAPPTGSHHKTRGIARVTLAFGSDKCHLLDWLQSTPGSTYFEEGRNLFPIYLSHHRKPALYVPTLGFKLCCSWARGPGNRSGCGER